jgi:restriction endonuclease S subunit
VTLHAFPIRPAQHWPIVELSEVTDLLTDGTHYTPPDLGQGIPFLTVKDVSEEGLDFQSCSKISRSEYDATERQNSAPKKGDILFSKDGTVGKVHLVREDRPFAVLSSLAILRPARQIDGAYLAHFLRTPSTIDAASKKKTGSAIRRIILRDLATLRIPLPPLDEQRRIARILDKADALRRKRKRAIKLLDGLTQSIFLEMFGDGSHFDARPLATFIDQDDRINYGVVQPGEEVSDGISLVRVSDLKNGRVDHSNLRKVSEEISKQHSRSLLRGNEILISCVGSIGEIVVVSPREVGLNIARAVARVPISDDVQRSFVGEYLRSPVVQRYFTKELRIVSQPTLNIKQISETLIPLPPRSKIAEFLEKAVLVRIALDSARSCAINSNWLFSSLQSRAFSGQL